LLRANNRDVSTVVILDANHLFISARTGRLNEYANLPKTFAPGVLDAVASWLRNTVDAID